MNNRNEQEIETSLQLFIVLSRASASVTRIVQKHIVSHGLNPTEFGVLELLYHKGETPLQQIGEKILITSGSITYVVDKLEKKGFLCRKACPNDRRITYAAITEKGKGFLQEMFPSHADMIHQAVSGLSEDEKKSAIQLLKKLGLSAEAK